MTDTTEGLPVPNLCPYCMVPVKDGERCYRCGTLVPPDADWGAPLEADEPPEGGHHEN